MFTWFIEHAPIRTKFNAMICVYFAAVSGSAACAYFAASSESFGFVGLIGSLMIIAFTLAFGFVTKRLCCDPYVNTVVRMEALADGDTQGEIQYIHHTKDCVGRMARAMLTFKENAEAVKASAAQQDKIVTILSDALNLLAHNNLTNEISEPLPQEYEGLRANYNNAIGSLRAAMHSVSSTKDTIDLGTEEITRATEDLAMRTQQQAENVERTLQEMTTISGEINKTALDAVDVNNSMTKAKTQAENSGEIVSQTVEAMARIERTSGEIASFVEVIDGIAFQTNLLALNAGVEAARAGDSGKGFAVVANEVRALAQRAAEAASDVKEKVSGSQREVETGVALVGDTGKALESISVNIVDVTGLVAEISQSTQRQASGITRVTETLSNIEQMTQQNAAMCEETSAATRALAQHSNNLRKQIANFQLEEGGETAPQPEALGLAA